ncbi:MAG TPA: aldo/keto reductase family protein [Polyangiaceae bacterium LLY-WYZ-15_(1-7)]|nr:aldo/keto reductase [Sandaracinus sp.]HJK99888.1 aldo/keto reductase family protein [Polyangiaceae bacterium LLY-WYZ-15_(1-7)]MBJ74482.1 aldo/keto reductase [Sandaracinus sp.]HJL11414.1 aldo/keto reductase family protein [Polyangiaceae bacterium LLY-WYZ-15_(1-7)]HJL33517.1 aldo/keto reductase family protein [Polyangiaceae bacterium LLY-WYZ-15_(1-7)]
MEHRRVGRSGLKVSAISLGGWLTFGGSLEDADAFRILDLAAERGVDYVDLADAYAKGRAEETVGRWLRERSPLARQRFVLASKAYWPMSEGANDRGLSRKHLFESVEGSLRRLGTDYLDLFFCHREDPEVPLEETLRALEDLVRQGKVLHWGTSCWAPATLLKAQGLARLRGWTPPIVEQPKYNLLERHVEKRIVPLARSTGMGLVVWSPLEGGLLTGKYDDGVPPGSRGDRTEWLDEMLTEENRAKLRAFSALAAEVGCRPAQLALAWALHQPGITSVITGASAPAQLEENLGALEVPWSDALAERLDALFPR